MSHIRERMLDMIRGSIDGRKRRVMRRSGIIGVREDGIVIVSDKLRSNRRKERARRRAERIRLSRPTIRPARPTRRSSRSERRWMNRSGWQR